METNFYEMATKQLNHSCYVSVVITTVATFWPRLSFDEQVKLMDLATAQIDKLYGRIPREFIND